MSAPLSTREWRRFAAALAVLALLTPVGLYLPEIMKAGSAWGEWSVEEVKSMIGYAPEGMEKGAGAWRAPMPDYALPGRDGESFLRRGLYYVLSAFGGIAACGGVAWLIARRLTRGRRRGGDE